VPKIEGYLKCPFCGNVHVWADPGKTFCPVCKAKFEIYDRLTTGGKKFTFIRLMVVLGIIAVPTGFIASALTSTMETEKETQ
jgi:hypothetical protein